MKDGSAILPIKRDFSCISEKCNKNLDNTGTEFLSIMGPYYMAPYEVHTKSV